MDDARFRRHDLEVAQGVLAPAQEDVAFLVAVEFQVGVVLERRRRCRSYRPARNGR